MDSPRCPNSFWDGIFTWKQSSWHCSTRCYFFSVAYFFWSFPQYSSHPGDGTPDLLQAQPSAQNLTFMHKSIIATTWRACALSSPSRRNRWHRWTEHDPPAAYAHLGFLSVTRVLGCIVRRCCPDLKVGVWVTRVPPESFGCFCQKEKPAQNFQNGWNWRALISTFLHSQVSIITMANEKVLMLLHLRKRNLNDSVQVEIPGSARCSACSPLPPIEITYGQHCKLLFGTHA